MAGLAHSDLSYKNVLVDPVGGNASINGYSINTKSEAELKEA